MSERAILVLRGVGKDFGARTAVHAIDLEVARGEILGLLGPNGAGKTTTISIACGIVTPTRGSVEVGGVVIASGEAPPAIRSVTRGARDPLAAKRKLGLVPQDLAIYDELSARRNLAFFGSLYGLRGGELADRIAWALGVVGLTDRADDAAKQYSGGMKRRLNLAAGLLHKPDVLVLDEPTVGVDPQSRNHIFETVRALQRDGMTVVYTSHYMEEVEALCDRVAIVDAGRIVAIGTVAELIAAHAGKGIALELAGDVERAAAAAAAHATVERDGDALRVVPTARLAPVIAAIEDAGATIARIESREANLETAFLALTGKALRDAAERPT
jgi:ABC-2 type transport system ATP-binding protein